MYVLVCTCLIGYKHFTITVNLGTMPSNSFSPADPPKLAGHPSHWFSPQYIVSDNLSPTSSLLPISALNIDVRPENGFYANYGDEII